MTRPLVRAALVGGLCALGLLPLAACAPDADGGPTAAATSASRIPTATATRAATPSPTATTVTLPADCSAIVSDAVLSQLADVPLNDPAYGSDAGVQADGSLVCMWGDPATDTGRLVTTISRMSRGPALDLMNQLKDDEAYTCYTPDGGTRCEKAWVNAEHPVDDGRTLFWRDDVMIDTRYSGLAPSGYTDAIVAHLFG